jgi:hypothetical protein
MVREISKQLGISERRLIRVFAADAEAVRSHTTLSAGR